MGKWHGTKEFWLSGLRSEGAALRAAVGHEGALAASVPSCPGWTGRELVRHLGGTYGWVHSHANRGVVTPPGPIPGDPRSYEDDSPAGDALLGWFDERYASLLAMLDALDPALPAWNWAPRAKTGEFWHRRMAHETAVHRWDAQMALGLSVPVEAKLAAEGVTEVLDTWLPLTGLRTGPLDRHGMIALHAADVAEVWHVRVRGEGLAFLDTDTLLDDDDLHERVVATGTASDILLSLYGRVPFDVLDVSGDQTLLPALRVGSARAS